MRARALLVGVLLVAGCGGSTRPAPLVASRAAATSPPSQAAPSSIQASPPSGPVPVTTSADPAGTTLATFFGDQFDSSKAFCTFSEQKAQVAGGALRISYPAGSSAPSAGAPYGGAQICEPFSSGPKSTASLSYQVEFPVGFQFVKGGKLPGLYGGTEPFSGGKHTSGGWSMRIMWRTGGAGEVYSYTAKTSGYGDQYGKGKFTFLADGKFHTLTERIVLNTPGQANGSVSLAYNGVTAITQTGILITDSNVPISGLFFSTFYGGHDRSWSPTADQEVIFSTFSTT